MSGNKISKEAAIKSMLTDLKKGIDKAVTLGKFGKKWEIPKSTYYRWYEEAEKRHQPYLNKIQEIENQTIEKVVSEIVTANIMSKIERQQLLSDIARGDKLIWKEAVSKEGVVQLQSYDPTKAIDLLNKMDGSYGSEETPADEVKPITFRIIQPNTND
jgi:hypothetical protein